MKTETTAEYQLQERLERIERRLDALDASRTLRSASIDSPGTLQVRDADGNVRLYIGDDDAGQTGLVLTRADGSRALQFVTFVGDPTPNATLRILDRAQNILLEEDETGGVGLSRPYIPALVQQSSLAYVTATNPTLTNLWDIILVKQHPKLEVKGAIFVAAGSTGQVDLYDLDNSTVVGATQTFTGDAYFTFEVSPSGSHTEVRRFALRGRRSAGAGAGSGPLLHAPGRG